MFLAAGNIRETLYRQTPSFSVEQDSMGTGAVGCSNEALLLCCGVHLQKMWDILDK